MKGKARSRRRGGQPPADEDHVRLALLLHPALVCVIMSLQSAAGCPGPSRPAGRIGKQVRNLCGTAAVRRAAPAKNVTVSMTREGWPGRGVLSAPTFQAGRPALRLILHAAPCLSGRREGRTRAADGPNAGAEKRLADALRALCAHCFWRGGQPLADALSNAFLCFWRRAFSFCGAVRAGERSFV